MAGSAKIHAQESFSNLHLGNTKPTLNEQFHHFKAELSKQVLSFAYRIGLGYTTLAESYDEHNSNLFREIIIEAQASQRTNDADIFSTIVKGSLCEVTAKLDKIEKGIKDEVAKDGIIAGNVRAEVKKRIRASAIYRYDVAGANIVHIAYLCKHYHIGHYLVRRYPVLASEPYKADVKGLEEYINGNNGKAFARRKKVLIDKLRDLRKKMQLTPDDDSQLEEKMLYTGENILHMTIIRRNYEEVRWLLDFYKDHKYSFPEGLGKLLNAEAKGKFFDRRGPFYFGSNPLQFAVCSNSTAIFDLVYSFVASIEEGDDEAEGMTTITSGSYVGPDVIFSTDQFGNNVLHLCVLHGLENMYEHVYNTAIQVMRRQLHSLYIHRREHHCDNDLAFVLQEPVIDPFSKGFKLREKLLHMPSDTSRLVDWVNDEAQRKVEERLVLALNEDLHSPLTLAASIIAKKKDTTEEMDRKVEMFRYLVDKMKQKLWEYGPVTMSILNLEGIEIKYNVAEHYQCNERDKEVANKKVHSAICWLCMRDADRAISIPEIEKLIQAKWERVGYPLFVLSFLINLFLTICVTLILIFINATPSSKSVYPTNIAVDILYAIVALTFFIMLLQELHDFFVFGFRFVSFRGVAVYDKILRVTKILSFVAFCCCKAVTAYRQSEDETYSRNGATVLYYIRDDQGIKVSIVVCVIASYLHLYYYFMGFDSTGPFVLTMFRIISKDVPYFMNFYLIVVVAFACALSVLSNNHNNLAGYGFIHLVQALWTLIQGTVGINNATHDHITDVSSYPQHLQWLAEILLTAYNTSVIILMLNLLIAMISNTYNAYCEYNDAFLLMAKYNIMNAMEWVMWEQELKDNRSKYAQIDEQKIKETLNETSRKIKPGQELVRTMDSTSGLDSPNRFPRRRSHYDPDATLKREEIDARVQTRYLFEMQTVNHAWCGDVAGPGGDNNTDKMLETLKAALSGQKGGVETSSANLSAQNRKTTLFIIDPQVDFHPNGTLITDDPVPPQRGSLAIDNAGPDSERIAKMIDDFGDDHIHEIFVSMDSHYPCHIAHAVSWHKKVEKEGDPLVRPDPYTQITNQDVVEGKWVYTNPDPKMQEWVRHYTGALERKGRMILTIWPEHCIIGSKGHSVVPVINAALQRWALRSERPINYVMKGQNLRVEMYSALQAEVEDPLDQNTGFNVELMSMLKTSDRLLICGQAMSHCVNYTTRDIIDHWDKNMSSIVLLENGASPVPGFEVDADEFKRHCAAKQVTITTIADAFAGCKPKVIEAKKVAPERRPTTAKPTKKLSISL